MKTKGHMMGDSIEQELKVQVEGPLAKGHRFCPVWVDQGVFGWTAYARVDGHIVRFFNGTPSSVFREGREIWNRYSRHWNFEGQRAFFQYCLGVKLECGPVNHGPFVGERPKVFSWEERKNLPKGTGDTE